ncbi:MAG: YihY/virulence factor BrkB family protein [Chloroflexi bacterium]|nr:YihY/virulence factor BrkB family protein [Chloroflexota bacterium]
MYWELAKRTLQEFLKDDCMHMAAGIAYYAFFSLFPLLLGLIAVLGFLLEPAEVQDRLLAMASQFLPGSAEIVTQNIRGVVASRGAIGILSVVGFLWSATAVFAAIRRSLNRAWNLPKERPLLQQKLLELGMLAGVGLLFLLSVAATAFLRFAGHFLPLFAESSPIWTVALALLPVTFSFAIFATVYRYLPNIKITWGDVWPGALLATVLFEISKNLFTWYLANFANYSLIYGSLAAVIAFLFWAFLSALIFLLGAEFTAEFTRLSGSHSKRPNP